MPKTSRSVGATYQNTSSRLPTKEEADAEANDGCGLCHVKAGEPCLYIFRMKENKHTVTHLRDFKKKYGQGRWVHKMRLEAREQRLGNAGN